MEEGRDPNPFFSTDWYLTEYPDIRIGGLMAFLHYVDHGATEGRNPNPFFDTAWYFDQYPSAKSSNLHPLLHFITIGQLQDYDPSPRFDTQWYRTQNAGVLQNGDRTIRALSEIWAQGGATTL